MEPKPQLIQDIAIWDPVAAYGILLGIPRIPLSMNIDVSFSSASTGQIPLDGSLDTTIAQRTWVSNMTYSLQQPNVFAGNVFKTLYDAMLKQQPGVSVKLQVQGGPRYLVSPEFTPLENVVNMLSSTWPAGWPLFKQQSILGTFLLTQGFPTIEPNAPPYNVTLTFNGWQFLDHTADEIPADVAANELRKAGFWVPSRTLCQE